jgi:hypothetical protein
MHVVAIHSLAADKESLAPAFAKALGSTVFEAISRLRAPGSGPFVVGIFGEPQQAARLAAQLEAGGFHSVVLSAAEIEAGARQRGVRSVMLGEQDLQVDSPDSGRRIVPYHDVDLILRGIGISSSMLKETTKKRELSLGSAVLSGGLKVTKQTKTGREVRTEEREGFLLLYAGSDPPLMFHENSLVYDPLGPIRGLSRSENFVKLIAELRRRCTTACYDERLLNKAGQAALLGPKLDPEEHSVVATALLAKVLRVKTGD